MKSNNTMDQINHLEILNMSFPESIDLKLNYSDWQLQKSGEIENKVWISSQQEERLIEDETLEEGIQRLKSHYIVYNNKYGICAMVDINNPLRHRCLTNHERELNELWKTIGSGSRLPFFTIEKPPRLSTLDTYAKIEKENHLSHIPEHIIDELIYLLYFKCDGEHHVASWYGNFWCLIEDGLLIRVVRG